MGVGSAESKGVDTRDASPCKVAWPWSLCGNDGHDGLVPGDEGIRLVKVQVGPQLFAAKRERDSNQARDTRRRFEVPNLGLNRADLKLVRASTCAKHRVEGGDLDRIPQAGARSVGLDIVDLVRRQPGLSQGLSNHPLLGLRRGHGEPRARPVLVYR